MIDLMRLAMYSVETVRWKITSSQGHRVVEFSGGRFEVLGLHAGKLSLISGILLVKKELNCSE